MKGKEENRKEKKGKEKKGKEKKRKETVNKRKSHLLMVKNIFLFSLLLILNHFFRSQKRSFSGLFVNLSS